MSEKKDLYYFRGNSWIYIKNESLNKKCLKISQINFNLLETTCIFIVYLYHFKGATHEFI